MSEPDWNTLDDSDLERFSGPIPEEIATRLEAEGVVIPEELRRPELRQEAEDA